MSTSAPIPPGADVRTEAAAAATLMAAERTLLSWIRTSFSMVSFGFALSKFVEYLHASRPDAGTPPLLTHVMGLVLVGGGSVLIVFAGFEFLAIRREVLPLLPSEVRKYKLAPTAAILLAALGTAAFVALIATFGDATVG